MLPPHTWVWLLTLTMDHSQMLVTAYADRIACYQDAETMNRTANAGTHFDCKRIIVIK